MLLSAATFDPGGLGSLHKIPDIIFGRPSTVYESYLPNAGCAWRARDWRQLSFSSTVLLSRHRARAQRVGVGFGVWYA